MKLEFVKKFMIQWQCQVAFIFVNFVNFLKSSIPFSWTSFLTFISHFWNFSMQTLEYLKKKLTYFLAMKTWKTCPQKSLIIGPTIFFSVLPTGPKPVQISLCFPARPLILRMENWLKFSKVPQYMSMAIFAMCCTYYINSLNFYMHAECKISCFSRLTVWNSKLHSYITAIWMRILN